jgi:RNA polymerase sigma-70 factor (ECF subfamily)
MDDDFISRAQNGDDTAFQFLVERYASTVWKLARVLMPSRALAEDASQEAWFDVWRSLARFDRSRAFRPWLLMLVANRCRKMLRSYSVPMISLDGDAADLVASIPSDVNVVRQTLHKEAMADLLTAIAQLPADQQRVLKLRFFAELDLTEIALVMETPLGTVKSRLHRALSTLRGQIATSLLVGEQEYE